MLKGISEIVNAQASLLQAQSSWRQEFPFVVATGTPSDADLSQFYGGQLGFYDFLISGPLRHANILYTQNHAAGAKRLFSTRGDLAKLGKRYSS